MTHLCCAVRKMSGSSAPSAAPGVGQEISFHHGLHRTADFVPTATKWNLHIVPTVLYLARKSTGKKSAGSRRCVWGRHHKISPCKRITAVSPPLQTALPIVLLTLWACTAPALLPKSQPAAVLGRSARPLFMNTDITVCCICLLSAAFSSQKAMQSPDGA